MEDLIDRQEAINVVAQYFKMIKLNGDICIDGLKMLPSAQPTVEAIPVEWIKETIKLAENVQASKYAEHLRTLLEDWREENE